MKARGRLLFLVCALAASMGLPAGAAAKPGYRVIDPSRLVVLSLDGSHGYSIDVVGSGSNVAVLASKGLLASPDRPSFTAVTYSVRGKVTDEGIEARYGSRGRVSVRMEPGARVEVEDNGPGCKGKPSVTRRGRFTGTIRFQGEKGFTRVRATQAKGFLSRSYRLVCKRPRGENRDARKAPPTTSLGAISSRYPSAPWFSVYKEEINRRGAQFSSEEANYTASATEKRQGMTIFRLGTAIAPPETFAVSPLGVSPITATVAPGPPFSGTAAYEKSAGGKAIWSGDLAVELPGRDEVSLADSTYRAKLCRSFACACPIGECFFVSVGVIEGRMQRLRSLAARVQP
jgi:hypothetical protein